MDHRVIARWSNPNLILVATNLLEGQTLILHAIHQAKLSRAAVLLVHVVRPPDVTAEAVEEAPSFVPSAAVQRIKATLDEIAMEFQHAGVLCEPIILNGHPAEQICELVKSRAVDRVIVASRYASGVARLVEHSVTEDLVTTLPVPVCIVGRRAHLPRKSRTPLERIMLATSLHSRSPLLASFANTLATTSHSHLTLLHVLENAGLSGPERDLARVSAVRRLCALISPENGHMPQLTILIREGDPAAVILEEASSLSEDILILGSPHPSAVSRFLTNSVLHRVVVEAQCPVLTLGCDSSISVENPDDAAVTESTFAHP